MRALVSIAAVAVVLLTGCGPVTPSASPDPSETLSASATPTPTPTPEPAALVIPECDSLVPLALAKSLFADNTEFIGEFDPAQFAIEDVPAVAPAVADATQTRYCGWGVPQSDGVFTLFVAEISAADRASLEAALPPAGFSVVTMGTVTTYEFERDTDYGYFADTLLFTGDVLIVGGGTTLSLTGAVVGSALDALRTENPTLGL
jgi:hypothetical protein